MMAAGVSVIFKKKNSTRDPPQNKGHIQTENEGLENDISCNWR